MKQLVIGTLVATLVGLCIVPSSVLAEKRFRHGHRSGPVAKAFKHSPRIGHRTLALPAGALALAAGALYFHSGWFYRPGPSGYVVVSAPAGTTVTELPGGYSVVTIGGSKFYRLHSTYYRWDGPRRTYVVVDNPESSEPKPAVAKIGTQLFVYPAQGQSDEERAKDRYQCHAWAAKESGVDPTNGELTSPASTTGYVRATTACLVARGYTVQ